MSTMSRRLVDKLVNELGLSLAMECEVEKLVAVYEVDLIDETRRLLADAAHKAVMNEYVEGQ